MISVSFSTSCINKFHIDLFSYALIEKWIHCFTVESLTFNSTKFSMTQSAFILVKRRGVLIL